ncbi:myb-related protein A isoform X2 [Acanthopagrus latus]|uniref:myb-related protein A isoform X2 n=1 Tax=Acanthopagrus latus TaxID=8177 RepID=UPI00187D0131|nr:myb-related protein A isoform X2 [Acanthopagrus latus]
MDNVKPRSNDEDEELHSTDPESKEKSKDKKTLCKVKWSRDEDEKLKKLVEQHGSDSWKLIANFFPGRTDGQCQHRWQKVLNPELVKGPWTKEEDQKVIDLVHKYGPKRWSVIAKHLQGRIGKQCRERWHNHLNPEVKKSSWTQEEDRIIYEAHKRLGNRWAEISKLLPGRTDNSIKNHWNSTMRRKVEHEGYLQDGCKSFTSSHAGVKRRHHRPCPPTEPQHCEGSPLPIAGQNQMGGYPYDPHSGHLMDSLPENSGFISPSCLDDPDREQRIKELELLLMSAESEVQRQVQCRGPRNLEQYSAWPDSVSDDALTTSSSSLEEQAETRSWRGPEIPQGPPPQLPVSPSKFLAAEASTVLSTLQTIPEFAETMELIDSDPVAWSEMASFDLSDAATPPRHNQAGYATLLQERTIDNSMGYTVNTPTTVSGRDKNCAPFGLGCVTTLTPINSSKPSQASTGRRRRRDRGEPSPLCDRTCSSFLENISNSPKKTPTKSLPFTPSRFSNISGAEHLNLDNPALTSTPVCGQRCLLNTPLQKETTPKHQKENDGSRTPKFRKTVMIPTPRTPTPFKNALAAQEKMHGPLKMEPQPLAFLEEDIREVLKQETGADFFNRADIQPEYRVWKHNIDGPARKVRKSLVLDPWEKDCLNVQLFQEQLNNAQVPDESLLTNSSLISPNPEQECSRSLSSGRQEPSLVPVHPHRFTSPRMKKFLASHKTPKHTSVQVSEWEAVVYGKTEDQLIMTEQARQYLNPYPSSGSTSRALVL